MINMDNTLQTQPDNVSVESKEERYIEIGQWFWVKHTDHDGTPKPDRFMCVMKVGSNYAELHTTH